MKKKMIDKWSLRAGMLAIGGIAAYYIKSKNEEVEQLKVSLERTTSALEAQNRVMKALQKQLGIEVDEGSD